MTYSEKVSAIEKVLESSSKRKVKNISALAKGLLFRFRLKMPFRYLPMYGGWGNYSWSNFRYWTQKLQKLGRLEEVKQIVWK